MFLAMLREADDAECLYKYPVGLGCVKVVIYLAFILRN